MPIVLPTSPSTIASASGRPHFFSALNWSSRRIRRVNVSSIAKTCSPMVAACAPRVLVTITSLSISSGTAGSHSTPGARRLDPAQLRRQTERLRRQSAEKPVGVDDRLGDLVAVPDGDDLDVRNAAERGQRLLGGHGPSTIFTGSYLLELGPGAAEGGRPSRSRLADGGRRRRSANEHPTVDVDGRAAM